MKASRELSIRDGRTSRTVIIGGGIAGLSAAFHLQEYSKGLADYTLLEGSPRWGGKIATIRENGFLIEGGPDSFLTQKKSALDLCRALGLDSCLSGSNTGRPTIYVWSKGNLHPMPEGMVLMVPTMILPFLRSRLISWPGKLRMGMELFIPRKVSDEDESLAQFVRRRLGTEALDKIAAPLLAGIHSADPERLSVLSTFPLFPEMERKRGSLLRGMSWRKRQKTKQSHQQTTVPMFMTLQGGMQQLSDAIIDHLNAKSLRLKCRAASVMARGSRYQVKLGDGSSIVADDVIFATPSYVTADLVQQIDPALAQRLRAIRYVSTATVSLGFIRRDVQHSLDGFGFIVPATEGRKITACSWTSQKFTHRAPDDCVLLRVFLRGALAEQDDAALIELARLELQATMGIDATPVLAKVFRWPRSTPQYEVGHIHRVAAIEEILQSYPGMHLAGAAYHGSGIPEAVQSGMRAALEIVKKMPSTSFNSVGISRPASVYV